MSSMKKKIIFEKDDRAKTKRWLANPPTQVVLGLWWYASGSSVLLLETQVEGCSKHGVLQHHCSSLSG